MITELDDKVAQDSVTGHYDEFYEIPEYVQDFIRVLNRLKLEHWEFKPWTTNQAVSAFYKGEYKGVITYEAISDNGSFTVLLELINNEKKEK